ncbi:hypothetical protein PLEOSDRAFT_1088286 [Pleurotus ostreatus PC15]|uniref:Transmembrane protein n=1 Tax=Pleurotus ostreatus (strain PC15) TaxID=1137138 RepID=A0A067P192_PLEO1|nr:hypothetical protein PLEOSDRAFT_1088286 [Pleurotus ostreatus PC15]
MARFLWLQLLALGFVTGSQASSLVKRQFQTDAVCDSSFSWAQNHLQQSPCLVAAYVNGACGSNSYTVRKLNNSSHYDPPQGSKANPCSCSWASYNLLSACTACQGQPESILTWGAWTFGCNGLLENDYFPQDITLAAGTAIPAWAATDPHEWTNEQFNVNMAKDTANQNQGDLVPEPPHGKSTPVGPIVGGVVGGIGVIGIAAAIFAYLRLRRRRKPAGTRPLPNIDGDDVRDHKLPSVPIHSRKGSNGSNGSMKSLTTGYYTEGTSYPYPTSPGTVMTHMSGTNPTQAGHSESLHSPPISPSQYTTPSPGPIHAQLPLEAMVEPFYQRHPSNVDARSEKTGRVMVYDQPNAYPSRPSTPARTRNPPAYTPSAPTSPLARSVELEQADTIPAYSEASAPRRRREKGSDESVGGAGPARATRVEHLRAASDAPSSIGSLTEMRNILGRTFNADEEGTATRSGLETGNSGHIQSPTPNYRPAI